MRDDPDLRAARIAALGGMGSGAALGGANYLVGATRQGFSPRAMLMRALFGGIAGGGLASGASYLGSKALGTSDPDDPSAYTHRGAAGGAIAGGALGAGTGAALASGLWKPKTENMILSYLKSMAKKPGGAAKGALLGAIGGGLLAGHLGGDEGMQVDFLNQELKRAKMRNQS